MACKCNFRAKAASDIMAGMAIDFFIERFYYDKKIKIGRIPPLFAEEGPENE